MCYKTIADVGEGCGDRTPSTTTPDRTSWIVICRGRNRFVDELHVRDPGHNPTSIELLLERSIANESELCSAELEQSRIEETHATQSKIPTNPVYCSKEVIAVGERKWSDILACESFKGYSHNQSWDWYVIMIKMNEKLTALFIGILWVPKLRNAVQKHGGWTFSRLAITAEAAATASTHIGDFCFRHQETGAKRGPPTIWKHIRGAESPVEQEEPEWQVYLRSEGIAQDNIQGEKEIMRQIQQVVEKYEPDTIPNQLLKIWVKTEIHQVQRRVKSYNSRTGQYWVARAGRVEFSGSKTAESISEVQREAKILGHAIKEVTRWVLRIAWISKILYGVFVPFKDTLVGIF